MMKRFLILLMICALLNPAYADNYDPQATNPNAPEMPDDYNIDPDDFPDGLQFRPENPSWQGEEMQEVRQILDEMFANNMRDEFLDNTVGWRELEESVRRGQEWIKTCREVEFNEVTRAMLEQQYQVTDRKEHLTELRAKIQESLQEDDARFNELLGDDSDASNEAFIELKKTHGFSRRLENLGRALEYFGREGAELAGRCIGQALAAVTVAKDLYDYTVLHDEASRMEALLPGMMEKMEAIAYMDVLIRQYEDLENAYEELVDDLQESFDAEACQECVESEEPVSAPEECPAPTKPPRPNRHVDMRELPSGQRVMTVGRETTLTGPDGKLQATVKNGTTIIYDGNGNVANTINREMNVEQINQILNRSP